VNDTEQIVNFFSGELNADELQAFQQRLQTDKDFADTVKLYEAIHNEMQTNEEEMELRNNLSRLTQKHFAAKTETRIIPIGQSRKKWWIYAAAAAVIVTVLLIFNPWQNKTFSNAALYAQYAIPDDLPGMVRGSNDDSLLIKATEFFNKKDYAAAIPLLDSITRQNPGEAQLQLSLGICYLQTGNYAFAINKFDTLATGESIYKFDAIVWKALALLKQDKRAECIAVLKQIPEAAGNYKKVEKMIKQLSR
jgi:tetratricopeptide (TPR) repeat protein